ncbi:MAG: thioredoxin family protein [Bacteroidota bacterium]|nr:thioredoxin family protein [Bacteroidota bacterium]MDX5430881.1 thioredoxin family protein [Bacteroidota bacterium]MDX5469626.1 thioredoxin family protein [Bacteroidota bacterium]
MKNSILRKPDLISTSRWFAFIFVALLLGGVLKAQKIPEPIWSYSFSKKEVKVGETVELIFTTTIQPEFYVYSNDFDPNLGPQITEAEFEKHPSYELVGGLTPIGAIKKYDEVWEGEVSIFKKKAEFRQKVKILSETPVIKGILYYQSCSDQSCVGFEPAFSFTGIKVTTATAPSTPVKTEPVPDKQIPETSTEPESQVDTPSTATPEEAQTPVAVDTTSVPEVQEKEDENGLGNKGLTALFLLGFAFGFGAVLTPCVFPMLPMTVAFFTKRQEKGTGRKMALFYGFSIVFIYTAFGLLLSSLFGATFGYAISTHWFPNMLFFVIFIIFGISFLGAFELVLPSSFVNKIDKNSDRGGYVGVFFIALTLVVISFSCTVPIVGSVAILAENGEILRPLAAMLGFSISFALPFTLFAFFPQWMSKLPKSGGWLNSVKVLFGFLEIGLALKFFSQADLAYHWGILDRDVFLAIWIVLAILMGMYFLGKLKFSHDSDAPYVSVPKFFIALVSISFAVYLMPGLVGAPLKPLAGILPPLNTQDFVGGTGNAGGHETTPQAGQDTILHADILHIPLGLPGFFDYDQGLAAVKQQGKPAFLDFTGHSCANCRKMEEDVWPNPEIARRLKDDVIIVSLYTDEKRELPESKWYTSERDGRVKKTVGAQNLDREISQYDENAQPMYFIVDENGKVLSKFNGYKNDPEAFAKFIDDGVAAFKAQQNK